MRSNLTVCLTNNQRNVFLWSTNIFGFTRLWLHTSFILCFAVYFFLLIFFTVVKINSRNEDNLATVNVLRSKFSIPSCCFYLRSKVPIYVMSSRDKKIKRTLLESGLGLLAKEYEKNSSYGHTRMQDNMVPSVLRALGTTSQLAMKMKKPTAMKMKEPMAIKMKE